MIKGIVRTDNRTLANRKLKLLNMLMKWEVILSLLFVIVIVINANLSPYFLYYFNIMNTTFNFMEKAIVALPMVSR